MALPEVWLDRLFAKLLARYGTRWLGMWEGVPIASVRADWAEVLDGLQANDGAALSYGLERLPVDYPPTAPAFKALCAMPAPATRSLPHERMPVNHEAIAKLRAKVGEFSAAADVRAREREAAAARSRPRTVVTAPAQQQDWRVDQGPLPWPRGVPRPGEAQP